MINATIARSIVRNATLMYTIKETSATLHICLSICILLMNCVDNNFEKQENIGTQLSNFYTFKVVYIRNLKS